MINLQIRQPIKTLIQKCQLWSYRLIRGLLFFAILSYLFTPNVWAEISHGSFPNKWIDGTDCTTESKIQVHPYNENLYIIRQSLCTNFEAPFIYLIFGRDKVILQDTETGDIPIAHAVDVIINDWLEQHNKHSIELIVIHSHSHGDHVAGDEQFRNRPNTTVLGLTVDDIKDFFRIQNWPTQTAKFDLGGGRVIDIIPIPGHQDAHIALYDEQTSILFSGDSLYPGRLYFKSSDYDKYLSSIERLVEFTEDRNVSWVLGTHIEMSATPREDFPFQWTAHPNEHRLELQRNHLIDLRNTLVSMEGSPRKIVRNDFILYPFNE